METTDKTVSLDAEKKTKKFKTGALILGFVLTALLAFEGGMTVGFRKARFSFQWGENYERNFIGPRPEPRFGMGGMMRDFRDFERKDFRNAYGISGTIISISENKLVVKDKDSKENTILVTDRTWIKNKKENVKINDLKEGDKIVVMGKPDEEGMVNADLIRIFN